MELPVRLPSEPPDALYEQPEWIAGVERICDALQAIIDDPAIPEFKQCGELPQSFFERLQSALDDYDALIDFALAFDGSGARIQCKKGCANCCIDLVRGVTTPEVVNIYHHVRGWPDAREIFEYHRDSAVMFMEILESKLEPGEQSFGADDPRLIEAHVEYNRRQRPCGFLDTESGCCRIYRVRPLACRYFFSFDAPEKCTPTHEDYLSRNTRTIHLPEAVHQRLLEIGRRFGFPTLSYLSGGFCGFAAEIMHTRPIRVADDENAARRSDGTGAAD